MFIDFYKNRVNFRAFTTLEECISLVAKGIILGIGVDIYGEIPMNESFLREIAFVLKDCIINFDEYNKGTQFWMDLCSEEQEVYLGLVSSHREERITLSPNIKVFFFSEFKGQILFKRTQDLDLGLSGHPLPLSLRPELMLDIKKLRIWGIHPGNLHYLVPFYDVLEACMSVSWKGEEPTRKDLFVMASFYEKLDIRFLDLSLKDMRGPYVFVTRCPPSSLHRDILRLFLTF